MEDLSHLFPDGPFSAPVPTGQQSPGPMHSSRAAAMTAPGSTPALAEGAPDRPGPHVEAAVHEPRSIVHGDRPVTTLRMGEWNTL
jgi:hypothetical protein